MNDVEAFSAELIKAQLLSAATITIFTNAIKDKDILTLVDEDKYITKAKELANKIVNSL